MKNIIRGRAYLFGDNLDTDQIYPGQYLELVGIEEIRQHAMASADPNFIKTFNPGDIIVAGTNFGCGSSREHAVITLKAVGTGAILAESFARIFYRNAVNLGVPLLICPGIRRFISQADPIEIDLKQGKVLNQTTGKRLAARAFIGIYPGDPRKRRNTVPGTTTVWPTPEAEKPQFNIVSQTQQKFRILF